MPSIHIIYASTSGHTEYTAQTLSAVLKKTKEVKVELERAEEVQGKDLLRGDLLVLASSTWNTGNVEGQLNPHMYMLLTDRAKDLDLAGKSVALIALGDERYRYTANAQVHLEKYVESHGGKKVTETLRIINEPYGQESAIEQWGTALLRHLPKK